MRYKTVPLLGFVLAVLVVACGDPATTPTGVSIPEPTPDIEARIEEKQAEDAALEARARTMAKAMVEATAQAVPTATPIPPSPTPTPTHTPTPDPYIALSYARQAMGNIDSYHADYVMIFQVDEPSLQLEMRFDLTHDYESPNSRVHILAEQFGERYEFEGIRIGNTDGTYRKYTKEFPSTEWTSEECDDCDFEFFRPVWEDSYLLDRYRVHFVGFEDLDGVSVYHFETDDPSAAAQMLTEALEFPDGIVEGSTRTRTDLWINTESHLIERIAFESDGIDASVINAPSTVTVKLSFELTLSAFNEEVVPNIVAPTARAIYTQEIAGFSIAYPVDWEVVERGQSDWAVPEGVLPTVGFVHPLGSFVRIEIQRIPNMTLEAFAAARIAGDRNFREDSRVKVESLNSSASTPGYMSKGVGLDSGNHVDILMVVNDPWTISVAFVTKAGLEEEHQPVFLAMIESIRIFPATTAPAPVSTVPPTMKLNPDNM